MTIAELKQQAEQAIITNDPEALLVCVNSANQLAKSIEGTEHDLLKTHAQRWRGIRHYLQGEYTPALSLLSECLDMYNILGSSTDASRTTGNIGAVHFYQGDYPKALDYYQRAYDEFVQGNDRDGIATILGNIGNIYMLSADYSKALEYFGRALEIHKENLNEHRIAMIQGNIGHIYKDMSEYPRALEYYHEALDSYYKLGDRSGIARITGNIAGVYGSTSDFPTALEMYHKALTIQEELGDRYRISRQYSNIAVIYNSAGEFQTALDFYERALSMFEELGDTAGAAQVRGSIGETLSELDRREEAEAWLRISLEQLKPFGHRRIEAHYTNGLCSLLIMRGEFVEAQKLIDECYQLSTDLPEPRIGFLECKALISKHEENLVQSIMYLDEALDIAYRHGLRNQQVYIHRALRDIYRIDGPLEKYVKHTDEIERLIKETTGIEQQRKIAIATVERKVSNERKEAERHRALLHNVMPEQIASRILKGETLIADELDDVAVFFLDLVSFTELSSRVAPGHLVHLLNAVFNACDDVMRKYGLTKIKTIGDAYMAVAGAPTPIEGKGGVTYENAYASALATSDLRERLDNLEVIMPPELGDTAWVQEIGKLQVRMGINIGPLVAGVVGTDRVAYDVWGDAVNVAARMEQSCEPGFIQVSDEFAKALSRSQRPEVDENGRIILKWEHGVLVLRGSVNVKGKGDIKTWWLERIT